VEVIYAENKTPGVTLEIIYSFLKKNKFAIVSRYKDELVPLVLKEFKNSELYSIDINKLTNILIIKEKTYKFEKRR
ncbi:unnamed protein product, partial [marine sediment metagenome]